MNILKVLPKVILSDPELGSYPLQRSMNAMTLGHFFQSCSNRRTAWLQPRLHIDVGFRDGGMETVAGRCSGNRPAQPGTQEESEARQSSRLCHRICNRKRFLRQE